MADLSAALRESLGLGKLIEEIRSAVREELQQSQSCREWYTLADACSRKGVCYNSVKSNHALQPKKGQADARIGGRRYWHRSTVVTWLGEVDRDAGRGPNRRPANTAVRK